MRHRQSQKKLVPILSPATMLCRGNERFRYENQPKNSPIKFRLKFLAVQEERGPRKPKFFTRAMIAERFTSKLSIQSQPSETYETAAHIFLFTIREVRYNSSFGLLNRHSQNKILGQLWAYVLCFRMAYSKNIENLLPNVKGILAHFRALKLDSVEQEFLVNIILCRKDLLDDHKQAALAEVLQEKAIDGLFLKNLEDKKRFLKIILAIPVLHNCSTEYLYLRLFKPIIGDVSMESVIATI